MKPTAPRARPLGCFAFFSVPALRKVGTFFALKGDNYFTNSPLNWVFQIVFKQPANARACLRLSVLCRGGNIAEGRGELGRPGIRVG